MNSFTYLLGALAMALLSSRALADSSPGPEKNASVWEPRTRSVSVFKNGLGFFVREGEVALSDGWCLAREIPPATFGTLAIYSAKPGELVDIVGSGPTAAVDFDGVDAPGTLDQKRARLEASRGLQVRLSYTENETERQAGGRLVSVGPEYVVLKAPDNAYAVPVAGITRLDVVDLPLRVHVAQETGEPPSLTTIGMAYLREGIVWIPEYTLELVSETEAELTLRGTLVNEAEDLVHCDVNFVVGVPHFLHTGYMAPVAVGQAIRAIGAAVAPDEVRTQIMNRAAVVANSVMQPQDPNMMPPTMPGSGDVRPLLGNLPQLELAAGSDYTVYTRKDLTVRRGEKSIVTLFRKRIAFSHIYRWSPPAGLRHFLVLHNETDSAWTTGPCLTVSGGSPLSEDLLRYTPRRGRAEVPVTDAVNISHQRDEEEVDRRFKAHSPAHDVFLDLVTLQGTISLKNFEPREVEVVVEVAVPGKPVSATESGKLLTDSEQLKLTERRGTISWRVRLPSQQAQQFTYRYERYVPSH